MVMAQPFTTASPIIASFDFTDISDGTGVVVFKGLTSKDNSAMDYHLQRNDMYSATITNNSASGLTTFSKEIDVDFDVLFNIPKTIRGIVSVNYTFGGQGGTGQIEVYTICKLRKWDGSNETNIDSVQSSTITSAVSGTVVNETVNLRLNTNGRKHFASDETLRITVEIWAKRVGAGGNAGFGHDPKDRNDPANATTKVIDDSNTTVMEVQVPFLNE